MGLLSKSNSLSISSNNTTIVASGTKIEGSILVESKLHIDGYVDGKIKVGDAVSIGKKGIAKGEIFAKKVIVSGVFEGNIESDIIEILGGGKVVGKILYKELIIEQKGIFIGESIKKNESTSTIDRKKTKEEKAK
ncbi:MAG TPA: cell shape determination protein CcmA [Nautiliaceae bacterium]|nr:cell shape determination protein CcmA [Nautiliaceae bacterium]